MSSRVSLTNEGGIGLLLIDNPPVNALSADVVAGLAQAVSQFEADASLKALVIACRGRTFVAGGDIRSFDDPAFDASPYNGTLARLEAADRPIIATLHGTVLGGGLELAIACHWRIAQQGTRLGFPEVLIGVLPGSLGTQRLPRLVSVAHALDMISGGQPIDADEALERGLLDAIDDASVGPVEAGLRYARSLLAAGKGCRPTSALPVKADGLTEDFFKRALADNARTRAAYPAPAAIVRCIEAAVSGSFANGAALEARLFNECRTSEQARAMRHVFFAQREAAKIPDLASDVPVRNIAQVGVIGAGTMGGGIAMNFANVGLPVVLVETTREALDRGLNLIRSNYEASARKGKLSAEQLAQRLALLSGSLQYQDLAGCDLVIEAVFENLALKQEVAARLGAICKAGAIIATNTSTLDVDLIAKASGRASDVVGLHFFSPANVMRLLEVVRGRHTAPEVLATVMALSKRIGKTAVVSGVCYGFIGNRMAEPYMRENEFLLLEGATPAQIDGAIEDAMRVGMAMGPCRMLDMAGIDVGAKTLIELGKSGGLPPDPTYRVVCQRLFAEGRMGQKTGSGYYRYEGRSPLPEPRTALACEQLAQAHGIRRRADIADQEIVERLLYPMINEAARILEEGIALRPGDVDTVWVAGYGFPDHRGGPLWMADSIGLPRVVEALQRHGANDPFGYWEPAKLLVELAESGQRISDWRPMA